MVALALTAPAARAGDVVEYFHLDAIGNIRVVTDQNKNVIERHDYLPFGEECTTGPCASNPGVGFGQPRKFTGKERDAETGLDYFGARYYGSRIGRFTTVDPAYNWNAILSDPQRWNRYSYSRNNPLRYVDPDGRDFLDYVGGVVNAFGSNLVFGAGRTSGGNSDFQYGQQVGDAFSLVAAGFEAKVGGGFVGGGGFLTATIVGAEVGVPALATGGALVVHSAGVGSTALMHLSKNVGESGGPKVGSDGGPGAGKRFSDKTRDAARMESPDCVFCDRRTTRQPGPTQSNIDHAKAKARGGNNTAENAQNTCRECNQRKGTKSTEEFLKPQ